MKQRIASIGSTFARRNLTSRLLLNATSEATEGQFGSGRETLEQLSRCTCLLYQREVAASKNSDAHADDRTRPNKHRITELDVAGIYFQVI